MLCVWRDGGKKEKREREREREREGEREIIVIVKVRKLTSSLHSYQPPVFSILPINPTFPHHSRT